MYSWYWLPFLVTAPLLSNQCDFSPIPGHTMRGIFEGFSCSKFSSTNATLVQCALQCYKFSPSQCRFTRQICFGSICRCFACGGAEAIEFRSDHEPFYLRGNLLVTDATVPPYGQWSIPDGLKKGRVIQVKCVLPTMRVNFILACEHSDIAFVLEINVNARRIKRNSRINGTFGSEETKVPFFNFTAGEELEVVYIVRHADYFVYINQVSFFTFSHRVQDIEKIKHFEVNGGGTGGLIKSVYVS
ncbi:hypothetical protein RRG08_001385 [Elysia crispata]|uniref:Galectin n=1 Tax=Elysia crispata TaxID=231223 RepID=A0AAE1DKZ4_9GAST|nr:hypothetical protein RRG08_001385 [Elysia crispata]